MIIPRLQRVPELPRLELLLLELLLLVLLLLVLVLLRWVMDLVMGLFPYRGIDYHRTRRTHPIMPPTKEIPCNINE